jgi:hypothetical protein
MTARQADELARCATDEERAQCTARHTEEQRVFERRQAEGGSISGAVVLVRRQPRETQGKLCRTER